MIHSLARFFRGINYALGITAPASDASLEVEKRFVYMWFGVIILFAATIALVAYLFVTVF